MAREKERLTSGGMLMTLPTVEAHHTIRYEKIAIHNMLPRKVTKKNRLPAEQRLSQDGTVGQWLC